MWCTMCHNKSSIFFSHNRELALYCIQEINNLIRFPFCTLEIHEWGGKREFFEFRHLHFCDNRIIAVFHARDNIQRYNSNTGISFSFKLAKSFFRSHLLDTFFCFNSINNDVRCICFKDRDIRMSFLNSCFYSINCFCTGISKSSTKCHNKNGILVFQILEIRV